MKPIIKWAGGKGNNLSYIRELLPKNFNTYYEPFAGGLAVCLDLNPANFTINDINSELISMYTQIRDNVEDVIKHLTKLDKQHEAWPNPKEYFYEIRLSFNKHLGVKSADQAARFIYLNKHCFNGLYRVNSKGEFNVPFNGNLSGRSFDPDQLRELSGMLKNANILNTDFEVACENASEGDFVFFDSPYYNTFDTYQADGFSEDDHKRLAKLFKELTAKGVKCMLTNSNEEFIKDLYKDFNIKIIPVKRNINRDGTHRTGEEIIVTNY